VETKEILKFCLQNGLLVDEEVLNLLSEVQDVESAKTIIGNIRNQTSKKIITKEIFLDEENASKFFIDIPEGSQERIENLKIKLGLRIEISKEISSTKKINTTLKNRLGIKILSKPAGVGKKYDVKDFVTHFRNRFLDMKRILEQRPELKNLISISKITGQRQGNSLIGIVSEKRLTKNA